MAAGDEGSIPGCMLGANLMMIPYQIWNRLSRREAECRQILSQMVKMVMNVKVSDPHFRN